MYLSNTPLQMYLPLPQYRPPLTTAFNFLTLPCSQHDEVCGSKIIPLLCLKLCSSSSLYSFHVCYHGIHGPQWPGHTHLPHFSPQCFTLHESAAVNYLQASAQLFFLQTILSYWVLVNSIILHIPAQAFSIRPSWSPSNFKINLLSHCMKISCLYTCLSYRTVSLWDHTGASCLLNWTEFDLMIWVIGKHK